MELNKTSANEEESWDELQGTWGRMCDVCVQRVQEGTDVSLWTEELGLDDRCSLEPLTLSSSEKNVSQMSRRDARPAKSLASIPQSCQVHEKSKGVRT